MKSLPFMSPLLLVLGKKGYFDEGNLAWPTRLFARRSDWSLGTHLHGIGNCKVL